MSQRELLQWTSQLSDDLLDSAEQKDLEAAYNFVEAMARVRVIRRLAEAYDEAPPDERPDPQNNTAQLTLQELVDIVGQIANLRFGVPEFHGQRASLVNRIEEMSRTWRQDLRPHIRGGSDLAERAVEAAQIADRAKVTLDELEAAKAELVALEAQAAELVEKVKLLSGDAGASTLASHYDGQAQRHEASATWFMTGAGVASAVLLVVGWILFAAVPKRASVTWNELVPELTIRLFTLGVIGYAVTFCAKSYRANKHLQYSNEHRRNALQTYILFRESTSSEDVQNIITTELVRAVFSAEETGFLDKGGDRTIIEEQSSLVGLLTAKRS